MKTLSTLIFLVSSTLVFGQSNTLTAEQILDSSIAFCGGEKRIAGIQSASLTYLLQSDIAAAVVSEKRKMGQTYVQSVISTTLLPQTTFFNNNNVTRVNGTSITRFNDLEAIEEIRLRTYNQPQYGYKALGYKLTRLPDNKFEHFDCYVVNATADNGYTVMNFFDKTNFRLLMIVYPNGNKSLMIDYTFKDNVLFNSHIVNTFADAGDMQVLKLQHVDLNIDISDLWFNCPYKDTVYTPPHIKTGKFESTNGDKTLFTRTELSQDYYNEQGEVTLKRILQWANSDTYVLVDKKAEILVRIISWDDNGYVCHWLAGDYNDTSDYRIKN